MLAARGQNTTAPTPRLRRRLDATVLQLRVTLLDVQPLVWRRVQVRAGETTVAALHGIVQAAMGWENYHLYRFTIFGEAFGSHQGFTTGNCRRTLADLGLQPGDVLHHEYDYGSRVGRRARRRRACDHCGRSQGNPSRSRHRG